MTQEASASLLQHSEKSGPNLSATHLLMNDLDASVTENKHDILVISDEEKQPNRSAGKSISLTWRNMCVNAPFRPASRLRTFLDKKLKKKTHLPENNAPKSIIERSRPSNKLCRIKYVYLLCF